MWAPSLSSSTEVKEETRGDKEERERRKSVFVTAVHAFMASSIDIVHRCVCVCASGQMDHLQ